MRHAIFVFAFGVSFLLFSNLSMADSQKMGAHHGGMHKESHGAENKHGGPLDVTDVWARATPGKVPNGAAFLTINNHRDVPDKLLSASSNVAERAEVHEHVMQNNIARMRKVEGLVIDGHSHKMFKPGGHHVMLMGLKHPLKEGDSFPLTLVFEKAGKVDVTVQVKGIGAKGEHGDHGNHGQQGSYAPEPGDTVTFMMHRISADGIHDRIGKIVVVAKKDGIVLQPDMKGLTPGDHAFHIHVNPDCRPKMKDGKKVAGLAAGGHFGGHDGHGNHGGSGGKPIGDLPDIRAGSHGNAHQPIFVKGLFLDQIKNRSLMIHEYPTEKQAGGPRVACGVVGK